MANPTSFYIKKLKDGAVNQVDNDLVIAKGIAWYQLKIILCPMNDFESYNQFSTWRLYTMSHSRLQTKLT